MSTKAYYPISEIGAGKVGFSKTRSIIEAAFYGNNVVKVNTLKEAYELAKNSPGTVVTDMPIKDGPRIYACRHASDGERGVSARFERGWLADYFGKYLPLIYAPG